MLEKYDDNPDIDRAVREYHCGLKQFERDSEYGDVSHKTTFQAGRAKKMFGVQERQTLLTGSRGVA
jgi:hypothetical protein